MPKISKSLINTKPLKSTIISLFRSSSSVKLFSATNSSVKKPNLSTPPPNTLLLPLLTSKQRLLSNSFFHTRVIHGGGPRNFCSISSSLLLTECEVNVTKRNIQRKNLCTLWTSIPVRAYCLSHNFNHIANIVCGHDGIIVTSMFTPGIDNYIVLRFDDLTDSLTPARESSYFRFGISSFCDSYMVVFKYGSTVMFNMLDKEVDGYMKIIKRHASGMLPETTTDGGDSSQKYIIKFPFLDCKLREKLKLPACVQGGLNQTMLQNFSIDGISTVASVLGQSAALDYYSRLVDRRISEYANVNTGLEETGTLCSAKKSVKLARKTRADAEVVYCFGLSERSDVTWKEDTEYSHMFDYLRDEFKLTQRFANLDPHYLVHYGGNGYTLGNCTCSCISNRFYVIVVFTGSDVTDWGIRASTMDE
ncbi:hypothetical protein MKW98_009589 [Papaver atlanticum]|uniref:DUF155 domain-containing protein n=1 Tax=Papaver atlanticum TaxID=357466 RepID=A0AAD4SED3_9MAGN|nr:hypothetical protein MKW98_009589 [Papaver atlanticum]